MCSPWLFTKERSELHGKSVGELSCLHISPIEGWILSVIKKSYWSGCHKEELVWDGFGQGNGEASKIIPFFHEALRGFLCLRWYLLMIILQGRVTVFVNEMKNISGQFKASYKCWKSRGAWFWKCQNIMALCQSFTIKCTTIWGENISYGATSSLFCVWQSS